MDDRKTWMSRGIGAASETALSTPLRAPCLFPRDRLLDEGFQLTPGVFDQLALLLAYLCLLLAQLALLFAELSLLLAEFALSRPNCDCSSPTRAWISPKWACTSASAR